MIKVILDTNYIVGLIDEKDIWNRKASLIEEKLIKTDTQLIFFDCVINVAVKRLTERKRTKEISNFIKKLQSFVPKENITWIYPEMERHYNAVIETVKNSQGVLNFHDALIVHVAKELGITHIVSFDAGFDRTELKRIKDALDIRDVVR